MTSIMSARIEGNRTSIVEVVEGASEGTKLRNIPNRHHKHDSERSKVSDGVKEIMLLEDAASFIDEHVRPGTPITHALVRELHKISVTGLVREGDRTPGSYRTSDVVIQGSAHLPPAFIAVQADMQELLDFINKEDDSSFDLLKVAIAHHRFVWIHPFGNGNGRTCRLLTYAIVVSQRFTTTTGYRAIDPTAVFGADRSAYYQNLEAADSLEPTAIIGWCTYLLSGMLDDLKKLSRLGDHAFVIDKLLKPSFLRAVAAGVIDTREQAALDVVANKTIIKASDLSVMFSGTDVARSQLDELGFLPQILRDEV